MRMRRFRQLSCAAILAAIVPIPVAAQLRLSPDDIRITQTTEGGYILSVRAEGIGSVMLTESTEDPDNRAATYAFRNPVYHPMNGDERRILDGEFLPQGEGRYFIIDSTPEPDDEFGSAFRLFIPYVVEFGYPWTRNGETLVVDGTYLSIRTFPLPYADYRGGYQDNPFILRVTQPAPPPPAPPPERPDPLPPPAPVLPEPEPESDLTAYMPLTVESFSAIADTTEALLLAADRAEHLPDRIRTVIDRAQGPSLDLVLVIDTTQSMTHSIRIVQEELVPVLLEEIPRFEHYRVGVVLFRDYYEDYLVRPFPFQDTLEGVQQIVDHAQAAGGRDIPEAVYEGIYTGLVRYDWEAPSREIILIGDAPPHPRPRGAVTREMVFEKAREMNVRINAIMLPHP